MPRLREWTPQPRVRGPEYLLESLASIGRTFMMDFGLAGLFDRFERDFGKRITFLLEALIGLAIATVCLGLVWQFFSPMANWLFDTPRGGTLIWYISRALSYIIGFLLLIGGAAMFANAIEARRIISKTYNLHHALTELFNETKELSYKTNGQAKDIAQIMERAEKASELTTKNINESTHILKTLKQLYDSTQSQKNTVARKRRKTRPD